MQYENLIYICTRNRKPSVVNNAGVAQLVEHNLAKVGVAGPSPVSRSFWSPDGGIGRRAGLKIL